MMVGIISKEAHAKSHQQALMKLGHSVSLLGGGRPTIAPNIDVIVCRPASCSHQGFDVAMAQKRAGRKVIIANGVIEILEAVKKMQSVVSTPVVSTPVRAAPAPLSTIVWISSMLQTLGIYGSLMHRDSAEPVIAKIVKQTLSEGTGKAFLSSWKTYINVHKSGMDRVAEQIRNDNGPAPKWKKVTGYYVPPIGKITHSTFVVSNPARVKEVFPLLNVYETEEEARKVMEAKSAKVHAAAAPVRTILKRSPEAGVPVTAPVAPAPAPAPAQREIDTLLDTGAAKMQEHAREQAQTNKAMAAFVELKAKAKAQHAWDASLRSAIALVMAEMKSTRVLSLTLTQDGKVTFQREEVVIVVKDGDMTVTTED